MGDASQHAATNRSRTVAHARAALRRARTAHASNRSPLHIQSPGFPNPVAWAPLQHIVTRSNPLERPWPALPHLERTPHHLDRRLDVPLHQLAAHPHNAPTKPRKPPIPLRVRSLTPLVVPAIDLDHDAQLRRREVDDILADDVLPPEPHPKLRPTEPRPQQLLAVRRRAPHTRRMLTQHDSSSDHRHLPARRGAGRSDPKRTIRDARPRSPAHLHAERGAERARQSKPGTPPGREPHGSSRPSATARAPRMRAYTRSHQLIQRVKENLSGLPLLRAGRRPSTALGERHGDTPAAPRLRPMPVGATPLADAGQHEPARLKFRQAYSLYKSASILFNLARAEHLTGRNAEAVVHYKLFLKSPPSPKTTEEQRNEAKKFIAELQPKVGQLVIDVPPGTKIKVDGTEVELGPPENVDVPPGKHTIEAVFTDGTIKGEEIECPAGRVVKVTITLDGGTTAPPPIEEKSGGWPTGKVITVAGLGVVAVTGGVLALVFAGKAQGAVDDSSGLLGGTSCVGLTGVPECDRARGLRDDRDSAQTLTNVMFVGAIAAGVGAVATWLLWPNKKATVSPTVGKGFVSLGLSGSF
jgi:hypothetical protein